MMLGAVVALASLPATAATSIDFSTYAAGTLLASAPGISLSMSGGPGGGTTPVIGYGSFDSVLSLNNSENWGPDTDGYPTNAILAIDFTLAANDISFTFANYGSGNGTSVRAYGPGGLISTTIIDSVNGFAAVALAATGVTRLEFDNNSGGIGNWIFGIGQLSFNAVPEPGTWAMLIAGFGLVGFAARRRNGAVVA